MKCIVKDCTNHEHEGRFSAELCFPCFKFIATGEGVHSQAYRNVQKVVKDEREECAQLLERTDLSAFKDNISSQVWFGKMLMGFANAIRARGEK